MRLLRYLAFVAAAGYLLTGLTQVGPEEEAVVRRFGRFADRWGPGLHIGLPYGLDRIDRVPVTAVRQVQVGYRPLTDYPGPMPAGQLLTADQNLIEAQVTVEYAVRAEEGGLEDYVLHRDRADELIARSADALMTEWAASRPVDEVIRNGTVALADYLRALLPARLESYRLGVRVRQVSVAYLSPPEEVKAAFEEVNRAQSAMLTRENQARRDAQGRLSRARASALRERRQAQAYRQEQVRLAEADAAAFAARLSQYGRMRAENPGVLNAIWWDEVGRTLQGMRGGGRIDLLDNRLNEGGLDVTQFVPPGRRR